MPTRPIGVGGGPSAPQRPVPRGDEPAAGSTRRAGGAAGVRPVAPPSGAVAPSAVLEARPALGAGPLAAPPRESRPLIAALAGRLPRAVAAAVLGVELLLTGCATVAPRPAVDLGAAPVRLEGRALDEAGERALVEKNRPGRLLWVHEGRGRGTRIAVHGIHASPASLQPVLDRAEREGARVGTFAYDDRYRRLTDSARDLAGELRAWLDAHPGAPLGIDAHSMGSRVTLAALALLAGEGALAGHDVELNLVAPPLGGYASANPAATAPGFLGDLVDGLRPGIDMGTRSAFQRDLETIALPAAVRTTIYLGTRDTIVDATLDGFDRVAARLDARLVRYEGETHDSIIGRFAHR